MRRGEGRVAMDPAALMFLAEPAAAKMVLAWPAACRRAEGGAPLAARWARLSGVDELEVRRLTPVLFGNGIVGRGGFVDARAQALLRRRLKAYLS